MYVEVSPRQTGKTTRLLESVVQHITSFYILRQRCPIIALIAHNQMRVRELKEKLEVMITLQRQSWPIFSSLRSINPINNVLTGTGYDDIMDKVRGLGYGIDAEPDTWFVDEFAFIDKNTLFPNGMEPMDNAYYCTTPNTQRGRFMIRTGSLYYLTDYCREKDIEIKFHNPWTEARLREQNLFAEYTRDAVLGEWVDFMEYYGFEANQLKECWIPKLLKRHRLC